MRQPASWSRVCWDDSRTSPQCRSRPEEWLTVPLNLATLEAGATFCEPAALLKVARTPMYTTRHTKSSVEQIGGKSHSKRKQQAARRNGRLVGRPRRPSSLSAGRARCLRMLPCALRQNEQAEEDETAITAEASGRLKLRPPALTGLSRKSPRVAPSGRVRIRPPRRAKRARIRPEVRRGDTARACRKDKRASFIPSPVSAIQSPSAVPSVCEKVMAAQ